MKTLTKIEALQECRKQWQWLADNPTACKSVYFDFFSEKPLCHCFACEYSKQNIPNFNTSLCCNGEKYTELCILHDLWPNGCNCVPSPYMNWKYDSEARREYALKIVEACDKEIAKLTT